MVLGRQSESFGKSMVSTSSFASQIQKFNRLAWDGTSSPTRVLIMAVLDCELVRKEVAATGIFVHAKPISVEVRFPRQLAECPMSLTTIVNCLTCRTYVHTGNVTSSRQSRNRSWS